jgi:hypothetical protein
VQRVIPPAADQDQAKETNRQLYRQHRWLGKPKGRQLNTTIYGESGWKELGAVNAPSVLGDAAASTRQLFQ